MMLRRLFNGSLRSVAVLGALFAVTGPTEAQVYGTAPPNMVGGQGATSIQLLNDADSGGDVWFLIDGKEESLKPGETMDLSAGRPHQVEFNTGGQAGDVKFTLYQGVYKFKVQPEGWGLFKSSSQPAQARSTPGAARAGVVQDGRFSPPLPAEDLRTRRMARGGTETAPRAAQPTPAPLKPGDTTRGGKDATHSLSAPTPPPPGITRERAKPAATP